MRSVEERTVLRGPGEVIAWFLAVCALIGAVATEGAGTPLLHAVLFMAAFTLLLGIMIRRRVHRRGGTN